MEKKVSKLLKIKTINLQISIGLLGFFNAVLPVNIVSL